jgi:ribosome-binding protein aMBF1 (putative translation factor)
MNPSQAITKLKQSGLTEVAIAAKAGSRQSTINRIARGLMQPNWELGQRLVDLAAAVPANPEGEVADAASRLEAA